MSLELIDSWVEQGDVGGVSAVVVDASGTRETRAAGDARPDSLFALASLTKPLVATAVLVAVEEGALELDDPVAAHIPEYGDAHRRDITVRHLLAHASGLPESVKGTPVLEVLPDRPPATRRVYSNEGYLVLGLLLRAATGIEHARYMKEAVLDPLGMDAFLLRYCGEQGDDRLLFFNLGRDLRRRSIPDPLVAPPLGRMNGTVVAPGTMALTTFSNCCR